MTDPALSGPRAAPARAIGVLVVATVGFALALALRERVDPWRSTAVVAALSLALSAWVLGPRLRPLFAIPSRAAVVALALGGALVAATHAAFRLVAVVAPGLADAVRALYASVDLGASRWSLVSLTALVVLGEELVWRGIAVEVVYARRPGWSRATIAMISAALYVLPQLAGGVPLLVLAAAGLGGVFAAQRMVTGRIADPLLTHLVWSISVFVLAPLA